MIPWTVLEGVQTPEGKLELRRRGERDFLMTVAGRVLMTSQHHRSEDALSELACDALGRKSRPRILLGGLGMGFSLRAALDRLRKKAVQAGGGISQGTEDAILPDKGLILPDNIAQADAIVEDEVQRLQSKQDGDTRSD